VLVLSQFVEPEYALALLEEGSDRRAYLLKERVHDRQAILSAVEKHINSIFSKLNLAGAQDVSQRVKAALLFLDGSR
jgi:hypothetical protein